MEPTNKPPDHKVRMTPIDSGSLRRDGGTKRTGIDRLSDVVDRLYGPDYRAARRLIHKRLRQKEMGSRGRKPPPSTDESLYQRIMAFRHGKGETPGSSPHPSTGTETPPTSSKQPNDRNRASQRQSPQANKTPQRSPPNRTPQRSPQTRTPQRSPPNRAQHRTPPQSSRKTPPQSNRQAPQKTPPAKRPVSRPRSRNAKKYELNDSPSPSKSKHEARSRDSSKGSFDSVDLPPLEDDDEDHNPTPKPTKQDRIQSTKEHRRHYRKNPETVKPEEPTTARDVYVEMGDEARDSSSRMSRTSARQDDLPPVREATPQRADRPLSRAHSDLNRHTVVPPIKSTDEQRQSRNNTPEQRENSRPSSNVSNRSRDNNQRSDDKQLNRGGSSQSDKSRERDDAQDRTSRQPSRESGNQEDRDDPRYDRPSRVESSRSNKPKSKPTTPDNRQNTADSRHNTPTSDDARATVLSPRDRGDSPAGPPPGQVPEKPSSSPQDGPVRQDEPGDANRGNPNESNSDPDQRPDANDDSPNNEADPDSPPYSPEPEIPRRTPKVREEDGRIAALDKLADYNLKTLAGQDAGEAPEIDDKIIKEVFSPEFQKDLDNFLKT